MIGVGNKMMLDIPKQDWGGDEETDQGRNI